MADNVQTYILKVNIGCCNACPKTLRKMLLKNKGVEKFDVDEEKSIVTVTGKVNVYQLIKDIKKKIKKNAELIKKESSDSKKKEQSEKESSDSKKKEQSEKENSDSANKQQSQESQEPEESSEEIHAGTHQHIYCSCHNRMQMPPPDPVFQPCVIQ